MGKFITAAFKWIPVIISAVGAVERMSTKKGKDKQDEAILLVGELIPLVEGTIPREVVDEGAVQDAIRKVIDAFVALQNIVRDVIAKRKPIV